MPNNGSSMKFQRPSRITTGRVILWTSKETVDQPTLDVPQPTQDGGNYSDTRMLS
jgi:hypothetical protein